MIKSIKSYLEPIVFLMSIILATAAIGLPIIYFTSTDNQKREGIRNLELNLVEKVKRVSYPRDFNNDNNLDYIVQYQDGRSEIFYGKGFDRQDISDKVKWNWLDQAEIEGDKTK